MRTFLAILLAFIVTFANPAYAARDYLVVGVEAEGGEVHAYLNKIRYFRQNRIRVVLRGECLSSCTLYSILLKYNLVCAKPKTVLVFHKFMRARTMTVGVNGEPDARWLDPPTRADVRMTWDAYPAKVRRAVLKRSPQGLPDPGNEVFIPATELGIPRC